MSNENKSGDSSKPWLSWPVELPTVKSSLDNTLYSIINDPNYHREMAQEIRANLLKKVKSDITDLKSDSVLLLAGGTTEDFELYDSDTEKCEFRQESFFRYLFTINEPDCYGLIHLNKGQSTLFVPEVSEDSERWHGSRHELTYYSNRYGVNNTHFTKDLLKYLKDNSVKHLYVLQGVNLDSGNKVKTEVKFDGIEQFVVDNSTIHPILCELRVFKTGKEIELMRIGNLISSQAHVYVMRHIQYGMAEMQLEAMFKSWCHFYGGCRHCAYTCICGSGANGSILHYGHAGRPNDRILQQKDTVVLDMGAEYVGYATDITRSFAISGKFTSDQRIVHDAVVDAQKTVISALKPDIYWPDMHRLAEEVIIKHLLKAGLLHNGTIEEMKSAYIGSVFMPHGLGHLIGLNVHDVGGYLPGTTKSNEPGLCWLRCGRKLKSGMIITVEPGVYFNDPTLNKALSNPNQAKYINETVLNRFRGTGGCRLEDDVVITDTGCKNLTLLPTTVEEIEEVIQLARK